MTIYDCPTMSWTEFLNIPDGETVFNHGASECVALANQYNEGVLGGGFVQVGSALQWWTNSNVAAVHGFDRIDSAPQVGDIFIGSCEIYDCTFGHIGVVVRAWDGSTFGTMEQNVGGQYVSRHNRTMANIDGFLRPINQDPINPPKPSILGTQRQAGEGGANRRAAPTTDSELLEPNLEPNEVGNFVNWCHGQDPYGNGNDIWFQGVSGNWFYSGAFTDAGTHDLNDVTGTAPSPVEIAQPAPTPDTVQSVEKPSVKPEKNEHLEKPVTSAKTEQEIQAELDRQAALAKGIKPVDLGSIITNPATRKVVWAVYGITGLFIIGVMGGLTAAQWIAPEWFIFATGVYTAVSPAFASLAIANIDTKK